MSVLKRLSRLEMSTHVKECVVLESYAFIDATLLIVTLLFTADAKRAVLVSVLEGFDASEILGLLDFFYLDPVAIDLSLVETCECFEDFLLSVLTDSLYV